MTWRERRRMWRRQTRLAAFCTLTAAAAFLSWRGVAPLEALAGASGTAMGAAGRADAWIRSAFLTEVAATPEGPSDSPAVVTESVPIAYPAVDLVPVQALPTAINLGAPLDPEAVNSHRRLTENACCAGAWWSADGSRAYFLLRAGGSPSASIYEAPVWPPGLAAQPADMKLTRGAGAARYTVRPVGGMSQVEDNATGQMWEVPTGGLPAHVASDGASVVWWKAGGDRGHFDAAITVYASSVQTGNARELVTLWGANVVGYLAGEQRVLVTGRPIRDRSDFVLAALDAVTGDLDQLAKGKWLSDAVPSVSGDWVAYMVSLDSDNPEANGIWLVGTHGEPAQRLPFIGSYRWRDGDILVYVPQLPGAASDEVWELDARTLQSRRLFDPTMVPLRIANNDWSVSPNGRHLMYRSADDFNLWLVRLP